MTCIANTTSSTAITGGGFNFSTDSIGGTWSWTVTVNNQVEVGQQYFVTNIVTPWGPLINTQVPIPSAVIESIYRSVSAYQQQLYPLLSLIFPPVNVYSIVITEGDPDRVIDPIKVFNAGAFGSYMTVTATPNTDWLSIYPTVVKGLSKNEQTQFSPTIKTSNLLNSGSPYFSVLTLQDNRIPSTVIPITIYVTVLPRPEILVSTQIIGLNFILSTMTPGVPQNLTVTNSGLDGSSLSFIVANLTNRYSWLNINPSSGGPLLTGDSTSITFSVVSSEAPSLQGTYDETVRVSSVNASNSPIDITVRLTVI